VQHAALLALLLTPLSERPASVVLLSLQSNFSNEAWREAEDDARTELQAMGFDVIVVNGEARGEEERRHELERATREADALAGLSMSRSIHDGAAELWVVDELTGKTSMRALESARLVGRGAARLVALRMVELLNASLLELRMSRDTDQVVPPVVQQMLDRVVPEPLPKEHETLWVGGGALHSASTIGTLAGIAAGMRQELTSRWVLRADFLMSALGTTLERADTSARVDVLRSRARMTYELRPAEALSLQGGPSLGALFMVARGSAAPPYESHDVGSVAALLGVGVSASLRLSDATFLHVGADLDLPWPRLRVLLGDEGAGRLSRGLVSGHIGVGAHL
jgi:hypothetical protein